VNTIQNCDRHPGRITQSGCKGIIAVAPSPGWHAEWDAASGREASNPLVGWGVLCNGEVVPLVADVDGSVSELSEGMRCIYRDPVEPVYLGLAEVAQAVR